MIAVTGAIGMVEDKFWPDIAGMPVKLLAAVACYGISIFTKGYASRIAQGMGDSFATVYSYKIAKQIKAGEINPSIAGELPSIDWQWER
jgi:hypothetical protein